MSLSHKEIHFIIGAPRSGTTILSKLLNNHPVIHCLPEANFLIFFLHKFKRKKKFSGKDIDLIFEQIYLYSLSHPWIGWEFNIEDVKKNIITDFAGKQISYIELCKAIYQNFKVDDIDKSNATILLDKNPIYTIFAGKLRKTIPAAKFILIIRDYRAHVLSRKQSVDFETPDIAFNALRWKLFNQVGLKFYKQNPKHVLLVKYEELILNKEAELKKICTFLNLSFNSAISENLTPYKTDTSGYNIPPQLKTRLDKKYSDLNKPVNTSRIDSWKTELTKEEILLCDVICGNFAKQLGYTELQPYPYLTKCLLKIKSFSSLMKASINQKKEYIIYYVPPKIKLRRLLKISIEQGFLKNNT